MTRTLAASLLLLSTFTIAGCLKPTGLNRCDGILGPPGVLQAIEDHGWTTDCTPPFPAPSSESGWANVDSHAGGAKPRTVYLWPDAMPDDRVLLLVAAHEAGHVVEAFYGHPPDETRASEYAWCHWPQYGVGMPGFGPPAEGCAGFIP